MTSNERFEAWWRLPDSLYKIIAHDAWDASREQALKEAAQMAKDCIANGIVVLSAGEVADAILGLKDRPL